MPATGPMAAAVPTIPPDARPMIQVQLADRPSSWSEASPWGYDPRQVASAYGFAGISFGGGAGDGAGQTIAIVDAYDDPALVDSTDPNFATSDLARFDRQYGLPDPPSFAKIGQAEGASGLPGLDPAGAGIPGNWEEEEALDVEWAHALAPSASIVLVECQSSSGPDLYAGARLAATVPGVSVVSMSWGSPEYAGEAGFDSTFTAPTGHAGVAFVAATGDHGAPGMYPADAPNVLAVGGTSMAIAPGGGYVGEAGWSNGGGGTSLFEGQPSYQAGVQATGRRTIPDVAAIADPSTGVSVYDSFDGGADGPWMRTGGTSLAAPVWSSLIAIADQGRATAGGPALDGASQVLPALYAMPAFDFHDITSGGNGVLAAGPGYDQSTGRGTPIASMVAPALAYHDLASWLAIVSGPPSTVTAGQPFGLAVAVESPDGTLDATYSGTVTIRLGADPGGAALGGTMTEPAVGGVAVFNGLTLTRAGSGFAIVAATDGGPAPAASSPFVVVPAAAARVVVLDAAPAGRGTLDLTIAVVDAYGNVATSYDGGVAIVGRRSHRRGVVAIADSGLATFGRLRPPTATPARRQVSPAAIEGLVSDAVLVPTPTTPAVAVKKAKKR